MQEDFLKQGRATIGLGRAQRCHSLYNTMNAMFQCATSPQKAEDMLLSRLQLLSQGPDWWAGEALPSAADSLDFLSSEPTANFSEWLDKL